MCKTISRLKQLSLNFTIAKHNKSKRHACYELILLFFNHVISNSYSSLLSWKNIFNFRKLIISRNKKIWWNFKINTVIFSFRFRILIILENWLRWESKINVLKKIALRTGLFSATFLASDTFHCYDVLFIKDLCSQAQENRQLFFLRSWILLLIV